MESTVEAFQASPDKDIKHKQMMRASLLKKTPHNLTLARPAVKFKKNLSHTTIFQIRRNIVLSSKMPFVNSSFFI